MILSRSWKYKGDKHEMHKKEREEALGKTYKKGDMSLMPYE